MSLKENSTPLVDQYKKEKGLIVNISERVERTPLISQMDFALLSFSQALLYYFLSEPQFLPFGVLMYILCHCRLEAIICILICQVIIKRLLSVTGKNLNFEIVLRFEGRLN